MHRAVSRFFYIKEEYGQDLHGRRLHRTEKDLSIVVIIGLSIESLLEYASA